MAPATGAEWTDERLTAPVAGGDAARPVMLSLPVRLLYIAAVALVLADVDWAAKAWALDQLRPDQLVLNTDRPWHAV